MTVTIKDVAREAGVATSTVSRTLKDSPLISENTKVKVRQAMQKLGYTPNFAAQNLANKSTQTIGVILPVGTMGNPAQNPLFLEMIQEIGVVCNEQKYMISLATGKTMAELKDSVRLMHQRKLVDGFILLYSEAKDPIRKFLHDEKIPYALLGKPDVYENETIYIDNDNRLSGKSAADCLIQHGHQRIGYVGLTPSQVVDKERYKGYSDALRDANLTVHPELYFETPDDFMAFQEFLEETKPTGLVVGDDRLALRVLQYLQLDKYKVPDDISLISFNNSVFATLSHPFLTTIDIHVQELARQAAALLIRQLNEPSALLPKMIVPHEVIERETVMRVRGE
ncbi:MAG: LacI family DNA-binding transcriptional regulator [Trichococcus sp.]